MLRRRRIPHRDPLCLLSNALGRAPLARSTTSSSGLLPGERTGADRTRRPGSARRSSFMTLGTVKAPTPDELREVAADLGMSFSDDDLATHLAALLPSI